MPKRASCLIIGRHPQVPREVRVVCKQLTGILQLGDCCSHLNIKAQGSKLMTPPEFEAAAGCSKGKNWKVSFGALLQPVSGHAACQWSCIMQLVSDHASCSLSCIMQLVSWSCIMQLVMQLVSGHASCSLSCIMQLVSWSCSLSCIMLLVSGHAACQWS